ncbi:hypothetical protein MRX96_011714 [Rhipicephalus microplus]
MGSSPRSGVPICAVPNRGLGWGCADRRGNGVWHGNDGGDAPGKRAKPTLGGARRALYSVLAKEESICGGASCPSATVETKGMRRISYRRRRGRRQQAPEAAKSRPFSVMTIETRPSSCPMSTSPLILRPDVDIDLCHAVR